MVAYRAYAADAGGDHRHLEVHTPFAELLKASELVNVEICLLDVTALIQVNSDLGVSFDSGYWFNRDLLCTHIVPLFIGIKLLHANET